MGGLDLLAKLASADSGLRQALQSVARVLSWEDSEGRASGPATTRRDAQVK